MHLRYTLLLLVFAATLAQGLLAQVSFSLSPTLVVVSKPKDNFVMYDFSVFQNLTGDTLPMRWVRTQVEVEQGGITGSDLGDWELGMYDPSNTYAHANKLDSADFILQAVSDTNDKFILQLHPNGVAGHLRVRFRIFPIADPTDSVTIEFDYMALELSSSVADLAAMTGLQIYPNPAGSWLALHNTSNEPLQITWVSADGRPTVMPPILPGETSIESLRLKKPGLWWLQVKRGRQRYVLPQVVGGE